MVTRSPFLTPCFFRTLATRETSVDAVEAGVQRAVLEPLDRDVVRIVGGVLHLGEGLDPVDALGVLGPEAVRVLDRARVHLLVIADYAKAAIIPYGRPGIVFDDGQD